MEGEFTGAGAQTMGAADVAGQQSGQEAAAQAQVQQQPVNVPDAQGQGTQEETSGAATSRTLILRCRRSLSSACAG